MLAEIRLEKASCSHSLLKIVKKVNYHDSYISDARTS